MVRKTNPRTFVPRRLITDDEGDWEEENTPSSDENEYDSASITTSSRTPRQLRPKATPRKKRQSSLHPLTPVSASKRKSRERKEASYFRQFTQEDNHNVKQRLEGTALAEVLPYFADLFGITFKMLKIPLALIFGLYLLSVILSQGYLLAQRSLVTVLAPLCNIPGASLVNIPFCNWQEGKAGDIPRVMNMQAGFEDVLQNTLMGSTMMWDLKSSEMAVKDLSSLVGVSDFICKDKLSKDLDRFVENAKSASTSLARFNSKVNGVMDNLVSLNEYAIGTLKNAQEAQLNGPTSVGGQLFHLLISPFKHGLDLQHVEKQVLEMFVVASDGMGGMIKRLILEAEGVRSKLDMLEQNLDTIHDMVLREDKGLKEKRDEVLADLWTILGGNRDKLDRFESHSILLKEISSYRKDALRHISASLIRLQQMSSDLDELRASVARPALFAASGKSSSVPLQVHIDTISKGVERLNFGKQRAQEALDTHQRRFLGIDDVVRRVDAQVEMNNRGR
ncbi:hypothetical protein RUND412_007669 [Rhizina undulata]